MPRTLLQALAVFAQTAKVHILLGHKLLGSDNNLDQYPGSDRPDLAVPGTMAAISTRYGFLTVPSAGSSGNLGRNASTGLGYASLSLRLQRRCALGEHLQGDVLAEGFNLLNRVNVRGVNPNYARAGEPLSAFDPRQVQLGVRFAVLTCHLRSLRRIGTEETKRDQ